jgi:hypothetical protein
MSAGAAGRQAQAYAMALQTTGALPTSPTSRYAEGPSGGARALPNRPHEVRA